MAGTEVDSSSHSRKFEMDSKNLHSGLAHMWHNNYLFDLKVVGVKSLDSIQISVMFLLTFPTSKIIRPLGEWPDLPETLEFVHLQLITDDRDFFAHKIVLAASSPYFEAMFTHGFKEEEMIELKDGMPAIVLHSVSSAGTKSRDAIEWIPLQSKHK